MIRLAYVLYCIGRTLRPLLKHLSTLIVLGSGSGLGILSCGLTLGNYMEYNDDEDDDFEGSGVDFSSNCFDGDAFPVKEKLNDPIKVHLRNAVRRHFSALVL
ncbi:hypothetical protein KSP40_PGU007482 [Platanthera guangdongensis]|uniref:Uncharacterized protein n=1 Tax=Platanthera guangdongensis TaxID=2320717 RepID=A0ABR2MCK4_9ASPA